MSKLPYKIEKEFTALMQKSRTGRLLPADVVEVAEDENHPLHNHFTWDNGVAAHKWRLQEAQTLIRSFTIYNQELNVKVRTFSSLESDRDMGGGYRWTMDVVERPNLRSQLLLTALHELEAVRRKYSYMQELADVWDTVDRVASTTEPVAI